MAYYQFILRKLEQKIALLQGKGYGTATLAQEVSAAQKFFKTPPTIILDIGANKGEYSQILCQKFPTAKVYAFEPSQTNIEHLENQFKSTSMFHLYPYALSQEEGQTTLYSDTAGSGMASLMQRDLSHLELDFTVTEPVQTKRFETIWTQDLNQSMIDFVKIDVEGYELDVLLGFGKALYVTNVIQFEFGGTHIDTRTFFKDFWRLLSPYFTLYRITPFGALHIPKYTEAEEVFTIANYLAVKK